MRSHSVFHRRPSPAIAISLIALFLSLGGVGYAATQIPNGSVGSAQLRSNAVTNSKIANNAVTYKKILPGSVGIVRANTGQLQVRVSGTCGNNFAIAAIDSLGKVSCNSTLPALIGTTNNTATVGGAPVTVTSTTLASGSAYLALANPTATVISGGGASQHVTVTCTLRVGSNTATRSVTLDTTSTAGQASSGSIPLQAGGPAGTGSVVCSSVGRVASVTSAFSAIQVVATG